ncbi:hypothetical protein DIPPA_29592 [Diplonema papillatum]|nr:hypothetical protein DIPPA_29592 [Diplonema papillatum]
MHVGSRVEVFHEGAWLQGRVMDVDDDVWVQPDGWGGACTFEEVKALASSSPARELSGKDRDDDVYSLPDDGIADPSGLFDDGLDVEVLYDKWYPGSILEYMGNDLYIIGFDSGEIAPDVHSSAIRPLAHNTWSQHIDRATHRPYYYNSRTQETTWTVPPAFKGRSSVSLG